MYVEDFCFFFYGLVNCIFFLFKIQWEKIISGMKKIKIISKLFFYLCLNIKYEIKYEDKKICKKWKMRGICIEKIKQIMIKFKKVFK